jgi:hypothetical protein
MTGERQNNAHPDCSGGEGGQRRHEGQDPKYNEEMQYIFTTLRNGSPSSAKVEGSFSVF